MSSEALADAIRRGDLAEFSSLLTARPSLASTPLPTGEWPLHLAAENDDPAMIRALVAMGAPISERINGGHTALSWAVTTWSFHAAHALVELGADPDLFCAAGLGQVDRMRTRLASTEGPLSETGSSRMDADGNRLPSPPTTRIDQISDALYIACRSGQPDAARLLLEHGADPNWRAFIGATPLHWAEFSQVPGLADEVRQAGGRDDLRDHCFDASPHQFRGFILAGWCFPVAALLKWLDAEPNRLTVTTTKGNLLDVAIEANNLDAVELLRARGLRPTHVDSDASPAP